MSKVRVILRAPAGPLGGADPGHRQSLKCFGEYLLDGGAFYPRLRIQDDAMPQRWIRQCLHIVWQNEVTAVEDGLRLSQSLQRQ